VPNAEYKLHKDEMVIKKEKIRENCAFKKSRKGIISKRGV
jgi:hypothetical protein